MIDISDSLVCYTGLYCQQYYPQNESMINIVQVLKVHCWCKNWTII